MRIWMLPEVPSGMLWDEGASGLDLTPLFHDQFSVFFAGHSGHPPIFFYIAAGALKAFGWSPFSLRLPAAFLNTLALPASFILARRLFDGRIAFFSCTLLATSLWAVIYSRLGVVHSMLPLFLAITGYWLARWLSGKDSWLASALTGFMAGLTFYTYAPGWFIMLVIGLAWLWTFAAHPNRRGALFRQACACAGLAAAIFTPLAGYFITHRLEATERSSELSIFNPIYGGPLRAWLNSVKATVLMFSFAGEPGWDKNIAHRPLLDPVISVLAVIGLVMAIRYIRRLNYRLVLAWLVIMLIPMTLTAKNLPDFGRSVGIAPILFILPALPIAWLWRSQAKWHGLIGLCYLAYAGLNAWLYFGVWNGAAQRIQVYRPAVLEAAQSAVAPLESPSPPARVYFGTQQPFDAITDFIQTGFGIEHLDDANRLVGYDARFTRVLPPNGSESYLIVPGRPSITALPPVRSHAELTLAGAVHVIGYDLPATGSPGEPLTLQVVWRPQQPPSGGLTFFAHLLDYTGQSMNVGFDDNGFPTFEWRGGETVLSSFPLAVPADVQPGAYWVEFGAYDDHGQRLPDGAGHDAELLGPVVLAPPAARPSAVADFGGYAGLAAPEIRRTSDAADVALTWLPEHTFDQDYSIFVHVLDSSGKLMAQADGPPGDGRWPTRYWLPGTPVTDVHHVSLRLLPPGQYSVGAGMYLASTGQRLATSTSGPEPDSVLAGQINVP